MKRTKIMGILNATPDSFYSKSRSSTFDKAIKKAFEIIDDGADIIDIGGESSRPGANEVLESEELKRVIPLVKEIRKRDKKTVISIDTVKPSVAKESLENGASLINDISGFENEEMIDIAKSYNSQICVMHMQNSPKTMQINPKYEKGIIFELMCWFENKIKKLIKNGINVKNIIIDPGIGFGKTVDDNLTILKNISTFKEFGFPLLIGISRKSFLTKILNKNTEDLLTATTSLNMLLIDQGVDIIRVHDTKEHIELVNLYEKLTRH